MLGSVKLQNCVETRKKKEDADKVYDLIVNTGRVSFSVIKSE